MDKNDITYGKIIDYIEEKTNKKLHKMEIQRYFYILQVSGISIGFNFKLGETQPYSKSLNEYLEREEIALNQVYKKGDFTDEFIVIIDKVIGVMNNPVNDSSIKEWQQDLCNYIKELELDVEYGRDVKGEYDVAVMTATNILLQF